MGIEVEVKAAWLDRGRRRVAQWLGVGAVLGGVLSGPSALAVNVNSPEVRKLVADGLAVLEKPIDRQRDQHVGRVGAKCVAGLAFFKAGKPDHPRVSEAVAACRAGMTAADDLDVYSNGLALVFLCEYAPRRHQREIQWYLERLRNRQMAHGGWGYDGSSPEKYIYQTGDTSQTQYALLGYWSAYRNGFRIDPDSLERAADWLLRTQDPNGCWGYQGTVAPGSHLVPQDQTNCSMLAAGLGSILICADLLDAVPAPDLDAQGSFGDDSDGSAARLPPALRPAETVGDSPAPPPIKIRPKRIHSADLLQAIDRARAWMDKNYTVDVGRYTYYYFYATERYQSFYELLTGESEDEPRWYNDGYEFLVKRQQEEGGWEAGCGLTSDTSFAVLFLLRSTQKSIHASLGEGTLVGGRGLPANVAQAKMRGDQIVVEQFHSKVDELLAMIDDSDQSRLDALARDPTGLIVEQVDEQSARRLQQLVRGGEPEVRLLAVRALARSGNLDYVPSLIYALTDPDRRIVLEARDGLRFVSRRFEGLGPPDDFTDKERYAAVDHWKQWYQSLRPGEATEQ